MALSLSIVTPVILPMPLMLRRCKQVELFNHLGDVA